MLRIILDGSGLRCVSIQNGIQHLDIFPLCMEFLLVDDIFTDRDTCGAEKFENLLSKYWPGVHIGYHNRLASRKQISEHFRCNSTGTGTHFKDLGVSCYLKSLADSLFHIYFLFRDENKKI